MVHARARIVTCLVLLVLLISIGVSASRLFQSATALASAGDITVDDYGATPNDGTDDTSAIQSAVNAAIAQNKARVLFNAGKYIISNRINILNASDLALQGAVKCNGMPDTTIEFTVASSHSDSGSSFYFSKGTNVAARNFIFSDSKPMYMVARIIEMGSDSITVDPLPKHRTTDSYTSDYLELFDLDLAHTVMSFYLGSQKTWNLVPGTNYFKVTGISSMPNVFVGEYVGWSYGRHWGLGAVQMEDCVNVTAQNLQPLNSRHNAVWTWRTTGNILIKDIYNIVQDGWYNAAADGPLQVMSADPNSKVTIDHAVLLASNWGDDSWDIPTFNYEIMDVLDSKTVKIQSGNDQLGEAANAQINEEVWLYKDWLDDVPDYKVRLAARPQKLPNDGWYKLTFDVPPPAGVLQQYGWVVFPRHEAGNTVLKNSIDLRVGRWNGKGNFVMENNFGLTDENGVCNFIPTGWKSNPFGGRMVVRNNDFVKSTGYAPTPNRSSSESWVLNQRDTPTYLLNNLDVHGNVFGNKNHIFVDNAKNPVVRDNVFADAVNVSFGSQTQNVTNTNNTQASVNPSTNYLSNGSFESGNISPWTVTNGTANVSTNNPESGSQALRLAQGYTVVRTTITGLSDSSYYRFGGFVKNTDASNDRVFFKVSGFTPYGSGALMLGGGDTSYAENYVDFKTFPGVTSVTLDIIRRGGTGDAFVDNLSVQKLNISTPAVEAPVADVTPPTPLPLTDGTYTIVDDQASGFSWSGSWGSTNNSPYDSYLNTMHESNISGNSFSYTFNGTGVGLYAETGANRGNITVSIDGGSPQTVSLNTSVDEPDAENRQQMPFKVVGLANTSHTIVVTNADNKTLRVDGLRIYGNSLVLPTPTPTQGVTPTPTTPPAGDWTLCANEGGTCTFSGTRQVRYGSGGTYAYQTATGSISCSNSVFGDPLPGVAKHCDVASGTTATPTPTPTPTPGTTPTPTGDWTLCANEGGTCTFSGTHQVRYGASGTYAYQTATNSIACSNSVFGDPVPGVAKHCDVASGTTATPTPTPTPTSPPTGNTTYLSNLSWASATTGYGAVQKDKSVNGNSIVLRGTTYPKGIGVHAVSEIHYTLNGTYQSFVADVGIDDESGNAGSVVFQVYADGVKVFDSGVVRGGESVQHISVSVAGVNDLKLYVADGGDGINSDHADWADAHLLS